jgi:uncharacterized C2H2 Zn-finger protein
LGEFVCTERDHKKRRIEICGMVFKTEKELQEHKKKNHARR